MDNDAITRAGAAGMIVSGAALAYSYVAHPHGMTPESIAAPFWIVIHALFALSLALGLLGTTALFATTAQRTGRWGLVGYIALFFGMLMIFGLDYYEALIAPYLAANYPQVIIDHGAGETMGPVAVFFPLAGALTVIGYAMLGYAWLTARVMPRPVALALIVSSVAFGFGLSPVGGLLAARITAAAFGASLIAIGASAWRIPGTNAKA